jgi:hypothetical protein
MSVSLDSYLERNQRQLSHNVHGAFKVLSPADVLSAVSPINLTNGIGKLIFVANAGVDPNGSITISGDTVDRGTGVITPADSEVVALSGLSTDASDTDAESNPRYAITDGYITTNWFMGSVTISTADVDLSDVDVYQCSFEQFNDENTTIQGFDISTICNNTLGWLYAYLYTVTVTAPRVDITRIASLNVDVGDSEADRAYRLKRKNLDVNLTGTTDGVLVDLFFGPNNQNYWDDFSMKIWRTMPDDASVNAGADSSASATTMARPTAAGVVARGYTAGSLVGNL